MATSFETAAKIVNDLIKEKKAGLGCCAPFEINGKRFDRLLDDLVSFEDIFQAKNEGKVEFGSLDIGITLSRAAIAQTGSVFEICSSDNERLLSSLSRVHISVLEARNIVENLSDIVPIIRSFLSADEKPTITLIGGPSRTSDIELKSVLGVHGPHEVHLVIIE